MLFSIDTKKLKKTHQLVSLSVDTKCKTMSFPTPNIDAVDTSNTFSNNMKKDDLRANSQISNELRNTKGMVPNIKHLGPMKISKTFK
jgi:hypothetical protein